MTSKRSSADLAVTPQNLNLLRPLAEESYDGTQNLHFRRIIRHGKGKSTDQAKRKRHESYKSSLMHFKPKYFGENKDFEVATSTVLHPLDDNLEVVKLRAKAKKQKALQRKLSMASSIDYN